MRFFGVHCQQSLDYIFFFPSVPFPQLAHQGLVSTLCQSLFSSDRVPSFRLHPIYYIYYTLLSLSAWTHAQFRSLEFRPVCNFPVMTTCQ